MVTIQKLKIFVEIYRHRSINKAAQALYLSQSALSQHLHDLEASTGVQLFVRSPQGVRPTAEGELMFDYAERILDLLDEMERRLLQLDPLQGHPLTVGATPGLSVYFLPRWLQDFQRLHPNSHVSLQSALTHEITQRISDKQYDLGFIEGDLGNLARPGLGQLTLFSVEYFVVVSEYHPWAKRESISAAELAQQPLINRQPSSRSRRWLDRCFALHDLKLKTATELDSPGTIKYALLSNSTDGIAILPGYVIGREVARGELAALQVEGISLRRPLQLLWDRGREFPPMQRAFLQVLGRSTPAIQSILNSA